MNKNYTHITFLVDRSGSMQSGLTDFQGGFDAFLKKQTEQPGKCTVSIYDFDTEFAELCCGVDVKNASYTLNPRGGTALIDSACKAIDRTGQFLTKLSENERPGLVLFVMITDGQENASREFKNEDLKKRIEIQSKDYNWQFIYLAADYNGFSQANSIGLAQSNSLNYHKNASHNTYNMLNEKVSTMRSYAAAGASDVEIKTCAMFSPEERSVALDNNQTP
jgi:hypothetical protein